MEFTVSRNDQYVPLYELVPVAPNQVYLLTAYVRSQDITSDSGPRLQVQDPFHFRGSWPTTHSSEPCFLAKPRTCERLEDT